MIPASTHVTASTTFTLPTGDDPLARLEQALEGLPVDPGNLSPEVNRVLRAAWGVTYRHGRSAGAKPLNHPYAEMRPHAR